MPTQHDCREKLGTVQACRYRREMEDKRGVGQAGRQEGKGREGMDGGLLLIFPSSASLWSSLPQIA